MNFLRIWLLFVSFLSVFGAIIGIVFPEHIKWSQFNNKPNEVTQLTGRLFGAWTLAVSFIRGLCAFHIHEKGIYRATIFTFILAFIIYLNELFISKTVSIKTAFAPLLIAPISFIWMVWKYKENLYSEHIKNN
jgi:hypothetical protein